MFYEFGEIGLSTRTIAAKLNAEKVLGARGSHRRASTINGDASRGKGILRNSLYTGRVLFYRTSKMVEPTDRSVRIRPNSPDYRPGSLGMHRTQG